MSRRSDGYSASAHILGVQPRLVARPGPGAHAGLVGRLASGSVAASESPGIEDLAGSSLGARLVDCLAGIRDELAQTTFFLTDPNSWR